MYGKWIISDLDGTLLNSRQQISHTIKQRVRLFQARGGVFTLATGRTLSSALPFIEELEIKVPVILYNGAKLYDPVKKLFLKEHFLPASGFEHTMNSYDIAGRELGLDVLVFAEEQIYCPSITKAVEQFMKKDKVHVLEKSFSDLNNHSEATTKIMFIGESASIASFQAKCFEQRVEMPNCIWHAVQSEPELLEILPPKVNKGSACLDLVEIYGLDISNFTAVGDHLNDLELIAVVRYGVAVWNAHPRIKDTADWVTSRSNDEDGILEVFDQLPLKFTV